MGGILSGKAILNEVELGRIEIEPFRKEMVNPASVDLTLGDEVAVYEDWVHCYEREKVAIEDGRNFCLRENLLDVKKEPTVRKFKINPNYGWRLKPGIGYLMSTHERIKTDHYVPVLDGKSSVGRLFIQIHFTAGFGDAGFDGQYTLEVSAQHPVIVYPGMRIAQIRFHEITGDVVSYQKTGNYRGELARGPVPSRLWKTFKSDE